MFDDSATLSWRPPEDDGGSYITNYIIEKLEPDTGKWVKAATSRSPRCTVENLLPNKPYQFRILAENIFGAGEPSEPTKTVQTTGKKTKLNIQVIHLRFLQIPMLVANDVPATTMHRDERTKIYPNWTTTIDAVCTHFRKTNHKFHLIYGH